MVLMRIVPGTLLQRAHCWENIHKHITCYCILQKASVFVWLCTIYCHLSLSFQSTSNLLTEFRWQKVSRNIQIRCLIKQLFPKVPVLPSPFGKSAQCKNVNCGAHIPSENIQYALGVKRSVKEYYYFAARLTVKKNNAVQLPFFPSLLSL